MPNHPLTGGAIPNHYPRQIEEVQLEILGYNAEIERIRTGLQQIEDSHLLDVMMARSHDGKAIFSNDASRGIEHRGRLAASTDYQECKKHLEEYEGLKTAAVIRLERLRGEFKLEVVEKWQEFGRMVSAEEMKGGIPAIH